jgi:hypothetical protein
MSSTSYGSVFTYAEHQSRQKTRLMIHVTQPMNMSLQKKKKRISARRRRRLHGKRLINSGKRSLDLVHQKSGRLNPILVLPRRGMRKSVSSYNHLLSDSGGPHAYIRKSKSKRQVSLAPSGLIPGWDKKKLSNKRPGPRPTDDDEDAEDDNGVVKFGGYVDDDESDEVEIKAAKVERTKRSKDENVMYQILPFGLSDPPHCR